MASARRKAHTIDPADRIGLSRSQSAEYLGIPAILFDQHVTNGTLPPPRRFGPNVVIWDREQLREAFKELPQDVGYRSRRPAAAKIGEVQDPFA